VITTSAAARHNIPGDATSADEAAMRHDAEEEAAAAELRVRVFDSIEAAAEPWLALEATGILTPYQRYGWVKTLAEARGLPGRTAIAIVEHSTRPVALFPFVVRRRFGVRTAEIIGADIGNTDWLVMERSLAPRLTPDALRRLFGEIGGVDMVSLVNQPESWLGVANPMLAFPHQAAPDHFYFGPIGGGGVEQLSSKRIRNIQRGRRRLEEMMGQVTLRRAETPDEIDKVHRTFLEQRGARFTEMGVKNIFAEDWFVRFFRNAAEASLGAERPIARFHALYAGDEIVATSFGTYAGTHYSQFINSTAAGPAAKYSLMGILMYDLVAELTAMGITSIDMGLGDFEYKTDWTERQLVYDGIVPLTMAGRLAAPALLALRRAKRAIKQNDRLFALLKRMRGMLLAAKG
jgi:CelD/BcsL family acetyltransferase involved in cellulose biosynthesis